jgi:hypothetical protein
MGLQPLAELAQRRGVGTGIGFEVLAAATQVDVVGEHSHDLRPVASGVTGIGRQQQLLFGSEVARTLPLEEVEESLPRLRCGLRPCTL